MTPDEFRKSIYRSEWASFLASGVGQELLNQLVQRNTPKQVDPASPVTAWVAAHEQLVGAQHQTEFLIELSQVPVPPEEEPKEDWGLPPEQLPDRNEVR